MSMVSIKSEYEMIARAEADKEIVVMRDGNGYLTEASRQVGCASIYCNGQRLIVLCAGPTIRNNFLL